MASVFIKESRVDHGEGGLCSGLNRLVRSSQVKSR